MLKTADELLTLATKFELAANDLLSIAKVDPKAQVRNRGKVVFPAESHSVNDKKDHFPINDEKQARNALAQAGKYTSAPPWYNGSLKALKDAVAREVKKHYKNIEVSKK